MKNIQIASEPDQATALLDQKPGGINHASTERNSDAICGKQVAISRKRDEMNRGKDTKDRAIQCVATDRLPGNMEQLFQKHHRKIFFHCLSMVKNREDARDLTQDILLKVYSHMGSFRGEACFSTWLYTITRNHCIEYHRKAKNKRFVDLELANHLSESEATGQEDSPHEELLEHMQDQLTRLSGEEKQILLLRYEQNLSIKELEQYLQLSPSAVKMRLMRARRKIKASMAHAPGQG